jgi:hypothetical protein
MNEDTKGDLRIAQGWRDGSITFPALLILLIAMAASALGAASIGGTGGTLVVIAILLSVIALLIRWAGAPR